MRGIVIPDEQEVIRETLDLLRNRFDHIFTSGGLGPTHDDVTVEGVALALGVRVVRHPLLESRIRDLYGDRLEEASLKMAEIPEGAELLLLDEMSFPVLSVENIYLFPGVPELFRQKFEGIKERFRTGPYHTEEIVSQLRESQIADILSETLVRFPSVKIGSYPQWGESGYRVKIVVESKEKESVKGAAAHLREALG
jgi:molybdopterin-biosynthesis enzyme MoeA-like protein